MVFSWLRRRRREKLLAEPFPAAWLTVLEKYVPPYRRLETDDQQRLQSLIRLMIAEKNWEGCGGLVLTDEIKVTIAAWACLLVLRLDLDLYRRLMSILVYPTTYVAAESEFPRQKPRDVEAREGESWHDGVIVLNWGEIEENLSDGGGDNLVLHEFAHQLDFGDYDANGIPQLASAHKNAEWREVIGEEYANLVAAARAHQPTLLNKYGTKNEAEFFAVASESFFLRARLMSQQLPRLYRLLADYYRQDPAQWRE
ncbi:MAG: zinc-dependent peptidase [Planctomycetes bacterium]|nr:zinc-dependent peptidase [Planctomycetota bacterium]